MLDLIEHLECWIPGQAGNDAESGVGNDAGSGTGNDAESGAGNDAESGTGNAENGAG